MPFEIVRNDIINMRADAIVNTTGSRAAVGLGTDRAINRAAGRELFRARRELGTIAPGCCAATPAFALKAKYVIHAVCPNWHGGDRGEEEQLRLCYGRILRAAAELGCGSIALPLLGAGSRGFPKNRALKAAVAAFGDFLMEQDMHIYLVVFSSDAVELSEKLVASVAAFIDDRYVERSLPREYGSGEGQDSRGQIMQRRRQLLEEEERFPQAPSPMALSAAAMPRSRSIDDALGRLDEGFSGTLLRLIDRSGMKDSEVYKKANVDRKLFSKIRSNPAYHPGKATAIAFALALELDMEGTRDLLARAGFALSHSSKFDIIIEYFIEQGNYDVFEINQVLFKFDQPLIGG